MIKLNGVEIKPTIFPDGTSQVWKLGNISTEDQIIEWEFESDSEIFHICQLAELISYWDDGEGSTIHRDIILKTDTMPYARQDKMVHDKNTFAQIVMLKLFKRSGIQKLETIDAHSNYGRFVMDIESKSPNKYIREALFKTTPTMVCYPDKGAKSRYESLPILEDFPNCSFTKDRDQETGHIKRLYLNELVEVSGHDILIVDDLCDGGMTFKLTAERLLELGANSVGLYTTHGIYSKGVQTLRDSGISRIFNRTGEIK